MALPLCFWFPAACRGGHYEAACVLLREEAAVDAHDGDGATPLLAAADAGFDRWEENFGLGILEVEFIVEECECRQLAFFFGSFFGVFGGFWWGFVGDFFLGGSYLFERA